MACECPIWVYGTHDNQQFNRQSLGTTRLEEAQAAIDKITKTTQTDPDSPTISGCIAKFLPSHQAHIGQATLGIYERVLGRFEVWCRDRGVVLMKDLTVDLLETFKIEGLPGLVESTRQNQFMKLKRFLREAFRRDWLQTPLYDKLPTQSVAHEQKQPYTDEEVEKIFASAALMTPAKAGYGAKPATFRLLLDLMLATGIRVSDAIEYDPGKVVKSEHFWIYSFFPKKRKKTAQPKLVEAYLDFKLKAAIDEAEWYSPSLPFMIGSSSKPRNNRNCGGMVWDRMQIIGKVAGVEDCRPHRLRDTFAVRCLLAGIPLEDVSRLLGHASTQITEQYYAAWTSSRKLRLERILAAAQPNGRPQAHL